MEIKNSTREPPAKLRNDKFRIIARIANLTSELAGWMAPQRGATLMAPGNCVRFPVTNGKD